MTCVSEVGREEVGRDKGRKKKKKGGRGDQVFAPIRPDAGRL